MYNVKVTLYHIEENSHFLLYYEHPEGVGFETFWASDKVEFIKRFTEVFESLPEDAGNIDLYQEIPVHFTEVGRMVQEMNIVP